MEAYAVAQSIYDGITKMCASLTAKGFTQTVKTHVLLLHPETHRLLAIGSIVYDLDNRVRPEDCGPRFRGYEIVEYDRIPRKKFRLLPREAWAAIESEWTHIHNPGRVLSTLPVPRLTGSPLGDNVRLCENCNGAGRIRKKVNTYLVCGDCCGTGIDVRWDFVTEHELPKILQQEKGK